MSGKDLIPTPAWDSCSRLLSAGRHARRPCDTFLSAWRILMSYKWRLRLPRITGRAVPVGRFRHILRLAAGLSVWNAKPWLSSISFKSPCVPPTQGRTAPYTLSHRPEQRQAAKDLCREEQRHRSSQPGGETSPQRSTSLPLIIMVMRQVFCLLNCVAGSKHFLHLWKLWNIS